VGARRTDPYMRSISGHPCDDYAETYSPNNKDREGLVVIQVLDASFAEQVEEVSAYPGQRKLNVVIANEQRKPVA
jgi:hypothetical protein